MEEGSRSFGEFLRQVCDGDVLTEATNELHRLMDIMAAEAEACRGEKKGRLSLVFDFNVDARGAVGITYDVTCKEPKKARSGGVAWLTRGRNLTFENPRQQKLPLVEVPSRRTVAQDEPAGPVVAEV